MLVVCFFRLMTRFTSWLADDLKDMEVASTLTNLPNYTVPSSLLTTPSSSAAEGSHLDIAQKSFQVCTKTALTALTGGS